MVYNLLITLMTLALLYASVGLIVVLFKKLFKRQNGKWFSLKKVGAAFVTMIALIFIAPHTETASQKAAVKSDEASSSMLEASSKRASKKAQELAAARKSSSRKVKAQKLAASKYAASKSSEDLAASKASSKKIADELAAKKLAAKKSSEAAASSIAQEKNDSNQEILAKLVNYTNSHSAGPTKDYYWENGAARIAGFEGLKRGDEKFTADSQGRSGVAKAILTYSEYESSKGSRQGAPLEPPAWPYTNPKVAITYSLTGRTYHGYLYNRSHSIGDSLLGADSYNSKYNFTTGTRPQNVGANQNGGMRYAEETAEDYWDNHPDTNNTIAYETTPLYKNSETIPRGSVVDIKSSDGAINKEIVVINSVEGISIDYNNGSNKTIAAVSSSTKPSSSLTPISKSSSSETSVASTTPEVSSSTTTTSSPSVSGGWTIAPAGQVFVSDSGKYYARVTNPGNYRLMSQGSADSDGYARASRGNQYARPY